MYLVEVRPTHEHAPDGPALFTGRAKSAASALRVAANALALCDREGWQVLELQPFPWGAEVVRVPSANDVPPANDVAQKPQRLAQ